MLRNTLPLTIRPNDPNLVTSGRPNALAAFKAKGIALWVRANGSAVLFYRDPITGERRQHTWPKTTLGAAR